VTAFTTSWTNNVVLTLSVVLTTIATCNAISLTAVTIDCDIVNADADKESTVNNIVGAAFGAAGQRCMALSVAVFVGDAQHWIPDIVAKAAALKVSISTTVTADTTYTPAMCTVNRAC
jgi:acyl-CoA reductase-like NAD-dependent aldehyde dehydrogenase